jgi:hypothetical protein
MAPSMHRPIALVALVLAAGLACSSHATPPASDGSVVLSFAIDAPLDGEEYECFGFDASPLAGQWVRSITWTPPAPGGVTLHHATLFAVPQDYPAALTVCDSMPSAWTMHVWAPGGDPLTLPAGVAIALPNGTRSLVVQAHALRFGAGPPLRATATIDTTKAAPLHSAAWLSAFGSVPAIRPQMQEHTVTTCVAAAPMHIFSAWPHMHLIGQSFQGAIVRADGTRTVIVDVAPWDFSDQRTYVVDQDVAAGDGIETDCTWFNPTDEYVLPGLSTTDEMCGDGLIVWPGEAAAWAGSCQ